MAALSAETLATVSGFPITNTLLATFLIDAILIAFIFYTSSHIKKIPGKFQGAVESLFEYFYDMAESMSNAKRAMSIFPWVMTFFIVIVVTNFLGLMPGIGSIGFTEKETHEIVAEEKHEEQIPAQTSETEHTTPVDEHAQTTPNEHNTNETATIAANQEHTTGSSEEHATTEEHAESSGGHHLITLLRPATSDFNATLALAFVSLLATHALSIKYTGIKDYLKRFFSFNPILLFVGLLELVSEFIKIFSLSFRLFGNIYAGEVVLTTISGLFAFLAPLPFLLLESIVAIVQGLVFAMLTLVFMSMLTEKHHQEGGETH